jgi:hypothetical protein
LAQTHRIFSFHPVTAVLQDVIVTAPWDTPDALYPPPHPAFLERHYFASIAKAMKDDDEDDEEVSEPGDIQNNEVEIWINSSLSGRSKTILRPLIDCTFM